MQHRKLAVIFGVLVLGVGLFFGLLPGQEGLSLEHGVSPEATPGSREPLPRQSKAHPVSAAPRGPNRGKAPGQVVIDAVEVDQDEVCKGEEVLVTVKARGEGNSDDYLNYEVLQRPDLVGDRFTMRLHESLGFGELTVHVQGKNGNSAAMDVPPVFVKDCTVQQVLDVELTRSMQAQDRAWLSARLLGASDGEQPLEPVSYQWDFGDGTQATTATPDVEHSYETRPHDTAFSYYLVRVTARDAQGRQVAGTRSLRFVNMGFAPLEFEKRVAIFAGRRRDEAGQERIWLYHGAPYDVELESVTVRDTGRSSEPAQADRTYEPQAFLGFARLPKATSLELRNLEQLRPDTIGGELTVEITGRTRGGKRASGGFLLTAESGELVLNAPGEN